MTPIKKLWLNYITSNIDLPAGSVERSRVVFINVFSLIGAAIELTYGMLNLAGGYYPTAAIEIAITLVILVNLMLLRWHRNVQLAARVLIVAVAIPLMTMLLTPSVYNTNVFWLPTFPIVAYLILGKKQGSTALFILFLIIGAMGMMEIFNLVELAYSIISIRQVIITLLVLAILLYIHENLQEQTVQLADERALAFRQAYQQARQEQKARDEYTITLAHELSNSLIAIQKLAETWRQQSQSLTPERSRQYMDLIHQSATDNLATVNSLLDAVNLDRAAFKVNKHLHSLREIVDQQLSLFRPQAQEAGVRLAKVFDHEVPWQMSIDGFRIKEVLTNLLSNAIKHTRSGNTITVQVVRAADQEQLQQKAKGLEISWYLDNREKGLEQLADFVFIGVSHPEEGINKKDMGKLFKKFSRLQQGKELQAPKGHGLGLYIIRRIIESHSGTYGVASQAGKGVTFYVTLPITDEHNEHQDT